MPKEVCWVVDCGEIDYTKAWELQQRLAVLRARNVIPDVLLLLEHPDVITMGIKAKDDMLRIPRRILQSRGVPVIDVNRGGKVTYHGPGQVVGYAVRSIGLEQLDAHLNGLEDTMLQVLERYKLPAHKSYESDSGKRLPGAWILNNGKDAKLGAIGVELRNGVTMHGFALNVNTNLEYFDFIDMCGFKDRKAVSMKKLLGGKVSLMDVKRQLVEAFGKAFNYSVEYKSFSSLSDAVMKATRNPTPAQ